MLVELAQILVLMIPSVGEEVEPLELSQILVGSVRPEFSRGGQRLRVGKAYRWHSNS